ncbi:hypothetical protein O59_002007 [Cellvibrio sp. BR]|uniref:hypothetical protein n=1 Tax=Cellvibrio sp. BR TaxID=1134474 RepID=UPI00026014AC|nr:hypothetical protein [Cellvibrio sp. BR]EIK45329.1 hypothetical protein O59_002007 [Cellvibrio sp. BR]
MNTANSLRKFIITSAITFFAANIMGGVHAEQIKIPIGQQTAAKASVKMPAKGMIKASVQAAFGEPLETTPAKGEPPISSWKYSEFVVYFEHDHVIHTVAKFKPQEDQTIILDE